MAIKIRNWHRFQHFKDRKPIWIKLYREILDDILWHELESDAAKCLVSLWLIASEHDGYLPPAKELAFRLRTTEKSIKSSITKLSAWLEQDDINPISDITPISSGYQDDGLEKRRDREDKETETEAQFTLPDWVPLEAWQGFCEMRKKSKAAFTERAKALLVAELFNLVEAGGSASAILNQSTANGWKGVFPLKANGSNGTAHVTPKIENCAACHKPLTGGWTGTSLGKMCSPCYVKR